MMFNTRGIWRPSRWMLLRFTRDTTNVITACKVYQKHAREHDDRHHKRASGVENKEVTRTVTAIPGIHSEADQLECIPETSLYIKYPTERMKATMDSVTERRLSLSHVTVNGNRPGGVEASSILSASLSGSSSAVCSPSPKSGVASEARASGSSCESRCAVWTGVWDMMQDYSYNWAQRKVRSQRQAMKRKHA